MALAIAEVQTPTRLAISASEIPYSRLKIQPILPRTRETACLRPPISRKACGPAEKEEMNMVAQQRPGKNPGAGLLGQFP